MSEEEKQAIEDLKSLLRYKGENIHVLDIDFNAIEIVLNLIEKQQKEIEEYNKRLTPTPDNYVPIEYQMINYVDKRNYISKDKIREKIKELEKEKEEKEKYGLDCTLIYEHEIDTNAIIRELKELLGEEQ